MVKQGMPCSVSLFYGLFRAGWKPQIALRRDTTVDNGPAEKGATWDGIGPTGRNGRNGWELGLIFLGLRDGVAGTASPFAHRGMPGTLGC